MAVVVLLHAFPLGPPVWEAQRQALTDAGHEVFVPDLLAAGRNYPDPPALETMAQRVLDGMDTAGHHAFAVAGLSMGGYVAMAMLRLAAHRVTGLALVDTKAAGDSEAAARNRLDYAARVETEGMSWVPQASLGMLLGETTRERRPTVVAQVREWILAADPAMVAWAQRAMANRPDSTPELQVYRRPSVVLVGQEDEISPVPDGRAMAEALGGAPLSEVAKAGHLSPVECPNRVTDMLVSWAERIEPQGRRAS